MNAIQRHPFFQSHARLNINELEVEHVGTRQGLKEPDPLTPPPTFEIKFKNPLSPYLLLIKISSSKLLKITDTKVVLFTSSLWQNVMVSKLPGSCLK